MNNHYEAIVVGAGPAGSAAALELARAGVKVILLERGEHAGAKNMFGGVMYGSVLNQLVPEYWREAPIERQISRQVLTFLGDGPSTSLDFADPRLGQFPNAGVTVFRSRFDRWLADKAVEAGATLVTEAQVDDLLIDKGRVVGVRVGRDEGEIYAPVVIAADGVNSRLARKMKLGPELDPAHVSMGIKQIVQLKKEQLEDRFGIEGNDGVAMEFVGGRKDSVHYGGFVYTNTDSVSVGIVCHLDSLAPKGPSVRDVFDDFKKHPKVARLLRDGEVKEYAAHLVPHGGMRMLPKLFTDGMLVVGDSAGLVLSTGLHIEGMNFAMASGMAAAEAVKLAAKDKDYSAASLRRYQGLLEDSFVLQDMKRFRKAPDFLANDRLHATYPQLAADFLAELFTSDGKPKPAALSLGLKMARERVSIWTLLKDAVSAGRSL